MRALVVGCFVLVVAIATLAVWVIVFSGPPINAVQGDGRLEVDTRFLGEYCIGLSEVELRDLANDQTVWHLRPARPPYMLACKFSLASGKNPTLPAGADNAVVVTPKGNPTFSLTTGARYSLRVCGNNGWALDRCSTATFQIPTKR